MKNHIPFILLSGSLIYLAIFFYQESQSHTKTLYAEPSTKETADSDQIEEISREDIIFKAKTPKTGKERSRPSEKRHPEQQTIKPHASPPATTGTVVSAPTRLLAEERSLARAQTSNSQPIKHTTKRVSLQETIDNAYEYLLRGKKYEARNLYSKALFMETSRERREIIRRHLDTLNKELIFSPKPGPGSIIYKAVPGDNLTKIAKKLNTTPGLIMRMNRKKDTRIRVNEPLKVLTGQPSILVDKSDFTLTLLIDGHYVKQYHIGTGKDGSTPEGTFVIETKLKNPVWYSPDGVYPYGHPKNILGSRWLGFQNEPGVVGYGIHGTTKPETIGIESSNGCIRMFNEDVEEIYDFVTPNTKVLIRN
ncbi:MAG: L,D-transpeptidase family protein [Candidatus Brocadiales bacterium]